MFLNVLLCITMLLNPATGMDSVNPRTINLNDIKEKADFKLYLPTIKDWKVELKLPSHLDLSTKITLIRLHYFYTSGDYIVGIEQHKAMGYKIRREETHIDVKNNLTKKTIIEEYFKPNQKGERVSINGIEARFEAWVNTDNGGILRWVNNETYIEMDSANLSKAQMINLAKSMK